MLESVKVWCGGAWKEAAGGGGGEGWPNGTGGEMERGCRTELGRHHQVGSRREQCSLDRRKAFESDSFTRL